GARLPRDGAAARRLAGAVESAHKLRSWEVSNVPGGNLTVDSAPTSASGTWERSRTTRDRRSSAALLSKWTTASRAGRNERRGPPPGLAPSLRGGGAARLLDPRGAR